MDMKSLFIFYILVEFLGVGRKRMVCLICAVFFFTRNGNCDSIGLVELFGLNEI